MILQKLSLSLKRRDWGAAIIEVGIVVLGIFIGLQVDDWNTQRQEIAREKQIIERLVREANSIDIELAGYLAVHRDIGEKTLRFLEFANANQRCTGFSDDEKLLLLRTTDFPPPVFRFTTVEELIQTGNLQIIRSEVLRQNISNIKNEIDFLVRQWERYVLTKQRLEDVVYTSAGLNLSGEPDFDINGWGTMQLYQFDQVANICQDQQVVALIANAIIIQRVYIQYIERLEAKLAGYQASLIHSQKASG